MRFRRRPPDPPSRDVVVTELLRQLHGDPEPEQPKTSARVWRWVRTRAWRERRRAGIPVAVVVGVWAIGQAMRAEWSEGAPWWVSVGIIAGGWSAVVVTWMRDSPHAAHSCWTWAAVAVYWLGVSRGA